MTDSKRSLQREFLTSKLFQRKSAKLTFNVRLSPCHLRAEQTRPDAVLADGQHDGAHCDPGGPLHHARHTVCGSEAAVQPESPGGWGLSDSLQVTRRTGRSSGPGAESHPDRPPAQT